ncbi:hypothetical protein LINPERPRIM_LOCUS13058, partial [Linum perenne]
PRSLGFRESDFHTNLKPFTVGWTENLISYYTFNKPSIFAPNHDSTISL